MRSSLKHSSTYARPGLSLSELSEDANLNPTLSNLPEQLKVLKDALEEETWRTRGYITDVELEQGYLRKRLQEQERPS